MDEKKIELITKLVMEVMQDEPAAGSKEGYMVPIGVSARHVHLTQEHVEVLFGPGYQLTKKKDLSQPGQYASNEKVTIVGPKKEMTASILGPVRSASQVEISLTDARTLVGPCGEVELKEGVIAAKRHIHATPEDAEKLGVQDKEVVSVKIDTDGRSLVFGDVVVRVSPKFALAMHIDTDESNAAGCGREVYGEIVK